MCRRVTKRILMVNNMRDIFGYLEAEERRIASLFREVCNSNGIDFVSLDLKDITHSFSQTRNGWKSMVIFECEQEQKPISFALPFDHFMDNNFTEVQVIL